MEATEEGLSRLCLFLVDYRWLLVASSQGGKMNALWFLLWKGTTVIPEGSFLMTQLSLKVIRLEYWLYVNIRKKCWTRRSYWAGKGASCRLQNTKPGELSMNSAMFWCCPLHCLKSLAPGCRVLFAVSAHLSDKGRVGLLILLRLELQCNSTVETTADGVKWNDHQLGLLRAVGQGRVC